MAKFRFELNRQGVRQMLRSDGVGSEMRRRAGRVASAAGPGHEILASVGRNRASADVYTATVEAMRSEIENRSLTRAIDAGR